MIKLVLPYPPALNSMYRMGNGNYYASKKSKAYKSTIIGIILEKQISCFLLEKKLSMIIHVYPPDKRRRDIDSTLKCLLDSLENAQVYENDCQIKKLYVEMREPAADKIGLVEVLIEAYD